VRVISRQEAARVWKEYHYLRRDYSGAAVEFGAFSPTGLLVGAAGFSAMLGGSKAGGHPDYFELRRFWMHDNCGKNSESRVLMYCARWIRKHCPQIRYIISYSDFAKMGHKGTIYKACGFRMRGKTQVSEKGKGWASHENHKVADNWSKTRWVLDLR